MRGKKAFTLIEVLVVAAIFAMLSTVDLINYRKSDRNRQLSNAADEMSSRIKEAQGLAYANAKQSICSTDNTVCKVASDCNNIPSNCIKQYVSHYGVTFGTVADNTKYMIGADYSAFGAYVVNEAIPNGIVKLPSGIIILSVTPAHTDLFYDLNYIYDSANASPFVTCSTNCVTTVVLKDTVTNNTKTVTVQKRTSLVTVQ
jgi:prepilin-type N-terminal cleavage/methylation domain-containing protein